MNKKEFENVLKELKNFSDERAYEKMEELWDGLERDGEVYLIENISGNPNLCKYGFDSGNVMMWKIEEEVWNTIKGHILITGFGIKEKKGEKYFYIEKIEKQNKIYFEKEYNV